MASGLILIIAMTSARGEWKQLPTLHDAEGFAGCFAGVSDGHLLVAGGANFPDKKPWEGGVKAWYDTVFALDRPDGQWRPIGKIPRPLGYGVSATHRGGVVCVGGADASKHHADAFRIDLVSGAMKITPLPTLPRPVAFGCGTLVGDVLYVAGGQAAPDSTTALKTLFALDLSAAKPAWREVEPWPGAGRILAVAAAHDGAFWILGGAELLPGDTGVQRRYLKDAYRYAPGTGWTRLADLPAPVVAAPSPAPTSEHGPIVLGGDDGGQVGIAPEKHRGFSQTMLRLDAVKNTWSDIGKLPAPRVTTPVVAWRSLWVVPTGERRPGVRSPEVWALSPK